MACPYFLPVEPAIRGAGPETAMLPLGDLWAGDCLAAPERPRPVRERGHRPLCNLGYARLECGNFPPGEGPDAVRFAVRAERPGIVDFDYVLERDHLPFAQGRLEYSSENGAVTGIAAGGTLARQARAYAESYLRRKTEASRS
jgi:hypothetical protein